MPEDKTHVSINQCITYAMLSVGETDDGYRNIMQEWAYEAQRHIGISNINKKLSDPIKIRNAAGRIAFDKPCDFLSGVRVKICGGSDTNKSNDIFVYYMEDEWETEIMDGRNTTSDSRRVVTVSEHPKEFILSSNAASYTTATIEYYAFPLFEDADVAAVPEYNLLAISAYCEFMFIKRKAIRGEKMQMFLIRDAEMRYRRLRENAISYKNTPSLLRFRQIVRRYNTLLEDYSRLDLNQTGRVNAGI